MNNEEKKSKKGLFKITKIRAAIGTVVIAAVATIFTHVYPFDTSKDLGKGDDPKGFEQTIGDLEEQEPSEPNPEEVKIPATPVPTPELPEDGDLEKEGELTPEDEDYYFDEEDEDYDLVDGVNEEEININPSVVDDFSDLVIPNINAYKGKGNSIVDALTMCGYPSDKGYRARLAAFFGIENYQRTAEQNLLLMEYLYQYYAYLDNNQDITIDDNTNTNNDSNTNNNNNNNNNGEGTNNNDSQDKGDKDKEEHRCSFGNWTSLNDDLEVGTCSCGKKETRKHPSYGPWFDLGNGKEARICNSCGHVQERTKQEENECNHELGAWESLNDDYEVRRCECGEKEEKQKHPSYGPWLDLGNGKEARICNNCGHVQERTKQEENECDHKLGDWEAIDDDYEVRRCECGDKEEKQLHPYGVWIDNGDGTCSRTCPNCGHKQTMEHHIDTWIYENDDYEVGYCKESGCLVRRLHPSLGEPVVTYRDNGDGTHTKVSTYHCPTCDHDIVKEEVLSHDSGTLESVDDLHHRLVCGDCNAIIQDGIVHELSRVEIDGKIYDSCSCGWKKEVEEKEECTHGTMIEDYGTRIPNPNPSENDYCYIRIDKCSNCEHTEEVKVYEHSPSTMGFCTNCWAMLSQNQQDFDYEVDSQDDYDYEVDEEDDFDLKEEDIPETAFLNLSRADINYMANKAIVRLDLENALNEEYDKAKTLGLRI